MVELCTAKERAALVPLFTTDETMVLTCLQGLMGRAWANCARQPSAGVLLVADFCFLAGDSSVISARELLEIAGTGSFLIAVPADESWSGLLERLFAGRCRRITRYAFEKDPAVFDRQALLRLAAPPAGIRLQMIDEALYVRCLEAEWSADLCRNFINYQDYRRRGLGVAALCSDELVCGASSYTCYRGGIEIEIDTREDFRRRGLATACAARLILECLSHGLYPSWDAANLASVGLAQKLGYHLRGEYPAYEIYGTASDRAAPV